MLRIINTMAYNLCDRRRCLTNYTTDPIINAGSNHAAMIYSHNCPFRIIKLWRKSL